MPGRSLSSPHRQRGSDRRILPVAALALIATGLLLVPGALAGAELEDLLWDLQIVPLDGQGPPGFALESLERKKVSLSDFRGWVVLLYFWASW